ncbi:protein-tyrosine-phosphatase MKP1 [Acrasis kona]|uniref:Protein-tyrosine-phosphatase MKP1 n=1 Tax=Acrasis kona TaxID=1008807 RepID=A0AAW2YVW9_9EUKA
MGANISIDTSPMSFSSFVKLHVTQIPKSKDGFKSNIKAWSFQPDGKDHTETEVLPVDFTRFDNFDNAKCYIVLHLFKRNTSNKQNKEYSNNNSQGRSLFNLAVGASKQLTPRGLEHRFSINDLQTTFFQDALLQQKTLAHDQNSQMGHDLYLWHGKQSSSSTQASAITRGFELERKLLERNLCDLVFDNCSPAPITKYFNDDVPSVDRQDLSNHKTSSVALYMSMYQHSHLFRALANNASSNSDNDVDEYHDIAFRSLLQLPPMDFESTNAQQNNYSHNNEQPSSPRNVHDDDDDDYMSTSSRSSRDDDSADVIEPPRIQQMKIPPIGIKLPVRISQETDNSTTSPRKRTLPEGFALDSERSKRGQSSRSGSASFRLSLDTIDRSENPLDPSPTPRSKLIQSQLNQRPMSGQELVVYYRKICSKVHDFMYLGSDLVARNKEELLSNNITHIVNAALTVCDVYFPNDFEYLALSLYDSGHESMIGVFFGVIEFIEKARIQGGNVYIHCYEGVSRSTTLTIGYLMWKTMDTFNNIVENVKIKRPVTCPNSGFIVQLLQWEKMLHNPQYYLYRISALNDMYSQHGQLIPKLCRGNTLDHRTCFVLHAAPMNKVFIWIGEKLILPTLPEQARNLANLLQKYFSKNGEMEVVGSQDAQFQQALDQCPVDRTATQADVYPDLNHMLDTGSTASNKKEPVANQSHIEAADVDSNNDSDDDLIEGGELYEYPSLDKIENFDSEDLDSRDVYILCPSQKDIIYVWVGADCDAQIKRNESIEYTGQDAGKVFISKKCLAATTRIVVVSQDQEPDEFWNYFESG